MELSVSINCKKEMAMLLLGKQPSRENKGRPTFEN